MIYLKIKMDYTNSKTKNQKSIIERLIGLFIPKANPDLEDKVDKIRYWLLEFENEETIPNREIGISKTNEILIKMPSINNYGYWTDNSLNCKDFKNSFGFEFISKEFFEKQWSFDLAKSVK